ncbi:transglutaminase family protein [Methanosarcina sp. KYL-1]|uniref:transglutaminase-like domain-containing protein n=1 Tax=Methanosarcina sp. KYL-1 TaxID=2602068 RepID=UPI002100B5DB|nr:transglutaminase family protein [Methanosarcina sp. KYL-1]MCQ1536339.1 transglutaminase family protein [Methanosarcina sp. KYL-1]
MKDIRISGKTAASIVAVLCICAVLATAGVLFSDSISEFGDGIKGGIKGFLGSKLEAESPEPVFTPDPASFTAPAVPAYSPLENEDTPVLRTPRNPGFSLSSKYQTAEFFQGGVSYVKVTIKNEGNNPIFIDRFGLSVNASENLIYSEDCGALLAPGEEQCLGVVTAQMPEGEETAKLSIVLWMLASTSEGKWHEYEPQFMEEFTADLKPMPEKTSSPYRYNPSYFFETLNRLVEPSEPTVREKAAEVARTHPGAYNIYQVCALFDKVSKEIEYINDPRGSDVWEPANATLKIGAGDCEDQAILLSSLLEAVGGTTRIYLTDTHAFAAVYIGNGTAATEAAIEGVRAYYGNVDVYYLTDEYGSWLMLDPTSSFYAGGLPGTTAPTKVQAEGNSETYRSWTFVNTSEVKVIDISAGAAL